MVNKKDDLSKVKAKEARKLIRERKWSGPTCGLALGYTQANLVILLKGLAYDFLLFAYRNPKPCPILDVTDVGSPEPRGVVPGADLRTDIPKIHSTGTGYKGSPGDIEIPDGPWPSCPYRGAVKDWYQIVG
ncbi:MAG: hypothetical protein NUV45_14695 [Tepidanaerobacteraceae bacterium]|jgi:uncharacterized protein YcsI (UPF0317 family)|nr:hypothetical protein [Tepidanaerobacteraceae bacterium]